jgi:YD repeat-containing protein
MENLTPPPGSLNLMIKLYDRLGELKGIIENHKTRRVVYDAYGHQVAHYDKRTDKTYDEYGKYVGNSDQSTTLLGDD